MNPITYVVIVNTSFVNDVPKDCSARVAGPRVTVPLELYCDP
jgi:hypothetical protein